MTPNHASPYPVGPLAVGLTSDSLFEAEYHIDDRGLVIELNWMGDEHTIFECREG